MSGLVSVFFLCANEIQAVGNTPPYLKSVTGVHLATIPTPTLPTRFTLLAPAFEVTAITTPADMTLDATGFPSTAQLAYRQAPTVSWQRIPQYYNPTQQTWFIPNVSPGEYALVTVTIATDLPVNAVIVDDLTSNFQRYGLNANWYEDTGDKFYLNHTYWTSNTYVTMENYGIWTPTTSLSGAYAVQVFIPGNYADTEQAVYEIYHNHQTTTYTLSQNIYWAEWVNMGTYTFTPATASYVKLTDVTYEDIYTNWVAFDTIAFVPQMRQVYLPLVLRNYPPPPKLSTGIHLGNRTADWTTEMLQPIDGERGGVWPAAVVVLSDQVWTIERSTTAPCTITQAYARTDRPIVYDYLKRAALNEVRVIVRIYPSPGNFLDWDDPLRQNHHLMFGATPAGENYCYSDQWPKSPDWPYGYQYFRATTDIVAEMGAIHASNKRDGWSESGFEPANEPNVEWYALETTDPNIKDYEVWDEMDTYFSTIHQVAHSQYVGDDSFNVFTPPMGQSFFADGIHWTSCEPLVLTDESDGYDHLVNTYGEHNDGYSWHNYWVYGREDYIHCRYGGQHVAYEFPTWVFQNIFYGDRPSQITEVDLASVCQNMGNVIQWKDEVVVSSTQSLSKFFTASFLPDVEIVWLLNDNTGHILQPEQCNGITEERQLREHDWHEAFDEDDRDLPYGEPFRQWFTDWWPITE